MALSEKLYALRKRSGLSQEQLAEELNVSRQAISKWESGRAVPESDKLLALSRYFSVSLDELMKDEAELSPAAQELPARANGRGKWRLGLVCCLGGAIGLVAWGLMTVFLPAASDRLSASSAVTLDGSALALLLCVAALAVGAALLLKHPREK